MKTLLLSALALAFSTSLFAEIPEIRAKQVSCQELQDAVRNYGQVVVLSKGFLSTKRLLVSQDIECGSREVKTQAFFKTSDLSACAAGVFCKSEPVIIVVDTHHPRHDRPRWRTTYRPRPTPTYRPRPTPTYPRPHRPHDPSRIPSRYNPGPRYNPRPDRPSRPSHERPSRERPSRGCRRNCSL